MTESVEHQLREDEFRDALRSMRHYSEDSFGSIPGARYMPGTFVTSCCSVKPYAVYVAGDGRKGWCTGCCEYSILKLIP